MAGSIPFPIPRRDLGAFEKTYETRGFSWTRILAFVASGLSLAMGIFFLQLEQRLDPSSGAQGVGVKVAIGLAVISFLCLLGGLLYRVKANRVALFAEGVAIEAEGAVRAVRWDEVVHYWNCPIGEPFRFQTDAGEVAVSNETAGFLELGATIRQRAGEEIYLREYGRIVAGGEARFGPLSMTAEGFTLDGVSYRWSDVRELYARVTQGHETLTFETGAVRGMGPSVAAETLPSVHVCFRVLEQVAPTRLLKTTG